MDIIGLNKDDTPLYKDDKSLTFAQNLTIDIDGKTYTNDFGWNQVLNVNATQVVGIIKTNNGWVAFCAARWIRYYEIVDNVISLKKEIIGTFGFNKSRPITGDYTYNGKGDLIVTFSEGIADDANETRVININDPAYDGNTDLSVTLTDNQVSMLNLIPDVNYPMIIRSVNDGGSLASGTYQFAIQYKLPDGAYTNYSILTPSISVFNYTSDGQPVRTITNKHILLSISNIDIRYSNFRIAIVYVGEGENLTYQTTDISITGTTMTYRAASLTGLTAITLEDVLIHNIAYIKESALANFQDRLYRANVSTVDYSELDTQLQAIADACEVYLLTWSTLANAATQYDRYFQYGEVYALYAGFIDYKGGLINIYPIPAKTGTGRTLPVMYNGYPYHCVWDNTKGDTSNTAFQLSIGLPFSNTVPRPSIVSKVVFFYIKHTTENSRILSNPIKVPDMVTNNFANNQTYSGQFNSTNKQRVYPFEFMFGKVQSLNYGIWGQNATYSTMDDSNVVSSEYRMADDATFTPVQGLRWMKDTRTEHTYPPITTSPTERSLIFTEANNSTQDNTAGESYYRMSDTSSNFGINAGTYIITNNSTNLYSDIYNQELVVASGYVNINYTGIQQCVGDTFAGWFTIRHTQPANNFLIGGTDTSKEGNGYVLRWISSFLCESKMNLRARFSANSVDRVFKLENSSVSTREELYRLNYQIDNLINNSVGVGYSTIYNNVGIENFLYYPDMSALTYKHITRIVRSPVLGSESTEMTWRYFNTDEYKEITANRGEIIELKTNQRWMYIQQRFGLRVLFIKDELNQDDSGGSYLGSSDLFDRDPLEIAYDYNGYIGCLTKFDTFINLAGYFVIDGETGRIFQVNESQPTLISNNKMVRFFKENLINTSDNNPFDYVSPGATNYHYKRWIDYNDYNGMLTVYQNGVSWRSPATSLVKRSIWGLHFHIATGRWISETYPYGQYSFNTRNSNIMIVRDIPNGTQVYNVLDVRTRGEYPQAFESVVHYDNATTIQLVFNRDAQYNKLLNNISWIDRVEYKEVDSSGNTRIRVPFNETISQIMVHNDDQCSGYKTVKYNDKWYVGTTGINQANTWSFNDIKDLVKTVPFLTNDATVIATALKSNPKWYNLNEFTSQYVIVTLKFENRGDNRIWTIEEIEADWILDNRLT